MQNMDVHSVAWWLWWLSDKMVIAAFVLLINHLAKHRLDRKLEKLKTTLQIKNVLLQKELTFYAEVFEHLTNLRDALLHFTADFQRVDPEESKINRHKRFWEELRDPFNSLLRVIERNQPFYPETLHSTLMKSMGDCHNLLSQHETYIGDLERQNTYQNQWAKIRETAENVENQTIEITAEIRNRLEELTKDGKKSHDNAHRFIFGGKSLAMLAGQGRLQEDSIQAGD